MPSERERLIGFLDAFRAAERAGAEAIEGWVLVCSDARLRGGLRVIRARDRRHAALAEARLRALGGVPVASVGRDLAALCGVLADAGVSDRSKLAILVTRAPSGAESPLAALVREIDEDAETRALLESIGDDERSSLVWLRQMRDALAGERA